jgi:FixJ family two-component response regulator
LPNPPPLVHVIDDDPSVVQALQRLLRSWGMEVRTFASGEEFLSAAPTSGDVDCVVLDVQMPGMSGFDVQERMRQAGWDVPIIFITGHEIEGVKERALQAGALGFLGKPFRENDLVALIRDGVQRRRQCAAGEGAPSEGN